MPPFVRRFRFAAAGVVAAILTLVVVVVVAFVHAVPRSDPVGPLIVIIGAISIGTVLAVAAIGSVRRELALRRVTAQHPAGLVFMARRQPSVVSDLAVYLGARGITADVADRWLVGLVDDRGISAWSVGSAPTELLLMTWGELGAIEVTDLESGGRGRGIAVDVRPFETPLIVSIGYSAFGLTSSLGREGVADVCRLANAQRPPTQADA